MEEEHWAGDLKNLEGVVGRSGLTVSMRWSNHDGEVFQINPLTSHTFCHAQLPSARNLARFCLNIQAFGFAWTFRHLVLREHSGTSSICYACFLNEQGDNIWPWHTPFPVLNQSFVSCPVLVASWPAHRFLRHIEVQLTNKIVRYLSFFVFTKCSLVLYF